MASAIIVGMGIAALNSLGLWSLTQIPGTTAFPMADPAELSGEIMGPPTSTPSCLFCLNGDEPAVTDRSYEVRAAESTTMPPLSVSTVDVGGVLPPTNVHPHGETTIAEAVREAKPTVTA